MEASKDLKSLLSIKVLRLLRPSLIGPHSLTCDNRDLPGDLFEKELKNDITTLPDLPHLSLGQFLRLPQGFGNMYLGETFSSYVCIQNESTTTVINVKVKVELQTQTQKFLLSEQKSMNEMNNGNTIDIVMHHEVKEMGKHILICTLSYNVPSALIDGSTSEPIILERFFKFQVKKPLDVKTKLYNSESDEVYLEAQVQNITSGPICLEKVDLEPSVSFTCVPMNLLTEAKEKEKPEISKWPNIFLEVESSEQFLFLLKPKPKVPNSKNANNIGKLDIVWRSSMCDRGRLQTSQLQRQPPIWNDLRIVFDKIPEIATVDKPFLAKCKLINTTNEREMSLSLELENVSDSYTWIGLTKTKIGILPSSEEKQIELTIYPYKTGLINISGIKLTDLKKGERFHFNDLIQVFILSNDDECEE